MESKGIVSIGVGEIYPHPENPRRDLGDLSELSESIRKNGVMQNLTVIPGHRITDGEWSEMAARYRENPTEELRNKMNTIHSGEWLGEGYTLVIGHRRFAAAKLAGLAELPCRVVCGMGRKEQVYTMLEENMQRNDLSIWEQANGFQMMLELGDTEERIAEKTGFSKATVRHRLAIAKLDQKQVRKKEEDGDFQLTLTAMYELEKVGTVRERNRILRDASNSRELVAMARGAVAEAKRTRNARTIGTMLKRLGITKAPEEAQHEQYSGKWKVVREFELEKDAPKQISLPEEKGQMYYLVFYRVLRVVVKAPKKKRVLSKYEKKEQERSNAKRQIKAILKEGSARRRELVRDIISGKAGAVKDEAGEMVLVWHALAQLGTSIYGSTLRGFFLDKEEYEATDEEIREAQGKVDGLGMLHQMLIVLDASMKSTKETYDWELKFRPDVGRALMRGYEALEPYGWYFAGEDERKVLDGSHELYRGRGAEDDDAEEN